MNTAINSTGKGLRTLEDDKLGAAGHVVSWLTAAFGLLTLQEWGVIVGILGTITIAAAKVWKTREEIKTARAAQDAEHARAGHFRRRSTD